MILGVFRRTVRAHALVAPGDRVLAAVSGGGDSVALLRLLVLMAREIPLTVIVAHVNHRLRGEASDEDQRFVEELSSRLDLELRVLLPDDAARRRMEAGGEEALRSVRHALLKEAARETRCSRIALAHTLDDQAETFLMRLIRGAGRRGLSAMAPAGPGPLIRPMLGITGRQARSFLAGLGQGFRQDETNLSERYLRNRVRAKVLPLLAGLNPSIVRTLARTSGLLAEEDRYLDAMASQWVERQAIAGPRIALPARGAEGVSALPIALARRVVRLAIERAGGDPRGASHAVVEAVLRLAARGAAGDPVPLAGGMMALLDGPDLVVAGREGDAGPARARTARRAARFSMTLTIPGRVADDSLGGELEATVIPCGQVEVERSRGDRVCLDAALIGRTAVVRNRLPGDTFHPLGGPGRRKLSDFLIDRKVPRNKRDRIPLVVGPVGIAWVVGERIGHPYRLTDSTRSVAVLSYHPRVDPG
ncbi:MAG TPA: tRNA lysidine(34) synthetase TilS [Candidatus Polarisedimenticolia bacterium]|jgi:tRNA(Ile)-lysidine synthase